MKTKIFFSLVSLSLTFLSAIASSPSDETDSIQILPAFVVKAPRQSPAEKTISQNLAALRAVAAKPIAIKISLPLSEARTAQAQTDQKTSTPVVVVAGL